MIEIKVPSPGESITEVEIASWLIADNDFVEKDQIIAEIDSDKATLELVAEESGKISLKVAEGDKVEVGQIVATIDTDAKGAPKPKEVKKAETKETPKSSVPAAEKKKTPEAAEPHKELSAKATPLAKEMLKQSGIGSVKIQGSGPGGKITRHDVEVYIAGGIEPAGILSGWGGTRDEKRERMSTLRRKVAERLVSVKQETAMLTTFNEVDMSGIYTLRSKYKDAFKEKYGVGLGFMSFFTKACTEALRQFPAVNGMIDGEDIVLHNYADIGVAVSSPKGLMVPVLRNAEQMSLAQIESEIKRLAIKARDGKLSIDEMTGGTFTITNGGVFGSMLSTPIINPPQSAILGMHNVVERPVAINGKVEIRPVMYVALSYDHRIIDGKESVSFLYKVKEYLENPIRLMFGEKSPEEVLLGL
jgi:2-oxoglutarate dehydrogenase E2 component (dihydrolipoamide succinyltransferase)